MSEPTPVWTLLAELATDDPTSAAALLSTYFHSRGSDGEPAYTGAVLRAAGCGPVTTGKLLARKRSRLLPVIDSVVKETLKHPRGPSFGLTLHRQLRVHDARLVTYWKPRAIKPSSGTASASFAASTSCMAGRQENLDPDDARPIRLKRLGRLRAGCGCGKIGLP